MFQVPQSSKTLSLATDMFGTDLLMYASSATRGEGAAATPICMIWIIFVMMFMHLMCFGDVSADAAARYSLPCKQLAEARSMVEVWRFGRCG
jgi:hypothetical protein